MRVLVVDDEPLVREALGDLIAGEPTLQLVGLAADGAQATDMVESVRPDVALIDVRMPVLGGAEATEQIRRRSPETQVVALSASEDRSSVLQMLRAGALGYLVKGVPVQQIVRAIHRAARGHGSISEQVMGWAGDELAALGPTRPATGKGDGPPETA